MRRADRITALLLLAFGVSFVVGARQFPYSSANGPGSGFLPFWLGLVMAALALMLFVRALRATDPGPAWLPSGRPLARIVVVVAATALFIGLMGVVGMALGTALFLVGLLRFLEGHGWGVTLGVAAGTALVNWLIFSYWLGVPFPVSVLGF
jgi:putative tricarboxylic transport membrane protein